MATQFIDSTLGFNESFQQNLICCIHHGLLKRPIILPAPCLHRLCTSCFVECVQKYGDQQINCPQCNTSHKIPCTWATDWFGCVLNSVTEQLAANQSNMNKKIIDFVQQSYTQFGNPSTQLKINSVTQLHNAKLKENFEKCKKAFDCTEVVTLLHGTDRTSAYAIGAQGFTIPTNFERSQQNGSEGELKFGKAIYFAHAKKASDYGKNIFVLTDCIFGRTKLTNESETVHGQGYDTIHFSNVNDGLINQEWAIYKSDQCLPLAIIEYELLDEHNNNEQLVINEIIKMNINRPNYILLRRAFNGTDNQCKAVLKFIGDAVSKEPSKATNLMINFLWKTTAAEINMLFGRKNEAIHILFWRLLWQMGRRTNSFQSIVYQCIDWTLLTGMLNSTCIDMSWRVCGVLANMAARIIDVRHRLAEPQVFNQLMIVLERAVRYQHKTCIVIVLNLLANIVATKYDVIKQNMNILNDLSKYALYQDDEDIQEAENRLFDNINGKGIITTDWQRRNSKNITTIPPVQQPKHTGTQKLHNIFRQFSVKFVIDNFLLRVTSLK